jgi:hypothetical protein
MSAVPIDLTLLETRRGPSIPLLSGTRVHDDGTGGAYSGFALLDRVDVEVKVLTVRGDASPALTVAVEHCDDGESWETAASHDFTRNETYRTVVDGPKDQLRVRWTVSGGLREAVIGYVAAVPGFVDPPAFNGGTITEPLTIATGEDLEAQALHILPGAPTPDAVFTIDANAGQLSDLIQVGRDGTFYFEAFPKGGVYLASEEDSGNPIVFIDGALLAAAAELLHIEQGNARFVVGYDGDVHIRATGAGSILDVKDAAGASVFRIDADGSVHIKTGTAIVADL